MKKLLLKLLSRVAGATEVRTWYQNLNDRPTLGHGFWYGRAKVRGPRELGFEWAHGTRTFGFRIKIHFFHGDSRDGLMLSIGLPYLFSYYLSMQGVFAKFAHKYERMVGVAYHNQCLWWYCWSQDMGWSRNDPWWNSCVAWHVCPWEFVHRRTRVLSWDMSKVLYEERSGERRGFEEFFKIRDASEVEMDYVCYPKKLPPQTTIAKCSVEERTWRCRWLPYWKTVRSVNIQFREPIGDEVNTWKGGTTGWGVDIRKGETPRDAVLRLMATKTP